MDIPPAGAPLPLAPSAPSRPAVPEHLQRLGREFESMFLGEMMRPMFEGLDTDGLGGGGVGEEMFRPMLIERYAEAISKSGGVGIADSIVRELMRLQASQTAPAAPAEGAATDETSITEVAHGAAR